MFFRKPTLRGLLLATARQAVRKNARPARKTTTSAAAVTRRDGPTFERECAEALKRAGWSVKPTGMSGDFGCDILVRMDRMTAAIQCKNTAMTGSAAVQEVLAGKAHHKTDWGVVVASGSYTAQARALAKSTKVLLLTFKQLPNLKTHIDGISFWKW